MKIRLYKPVILIIGVLFIINCASQEKFEIHERSHKLSKNKETETRFKGLKKTPQDFIKKFKSKRRPLKSVQGESLPASVDLSKYLPEPGDQGNQGSCTGWSTAYAYKTFHECVERDWALNTNSHLFSPSYIYNQINEGVDEGAFIPDALELMKTKGCATMSAMPYNEDDFTAQPSSSAHNEAKKYKAKSYMSVDFHNQYQMKSILAGKNCIVVGIDIYENFDSYSGGIYKSIRGYNMGGHAILVIGYNDSKKAYRLINSWGTYWGEKGYVWINYDTFTQIAFEAWVMYDDIQTIPARVPLPPSNIIASQGAYDNQVKINWDNVTNADSYIVYRVLLNGKNVKEIGKTSKDVYFDTDVTPGIIYLYSIVSIGKAGKSDYSDYVEGYARDIEKNKKPGTPLDVNLSMHNASVFIKWDTVKSAENYNVYQWNNTKKKWDKIGTATETSYFDSKVENNKKYWYSITAVNKYGESEGSEAASIYVMKETVQIPAIPPNIKVSQGKYTDKIIVSWSEVENAETYTIERWHSGMSAWETLTNTSATTITDSQVEQGIYYYYSVSAGNKAGYSDFSEYEYGYVKEKDYKEDWKEWENFDDFEDWEEWLDMDDEEWNFDNEDYYKDDYTESSGYLYSGKIYNSNNGTCEITGISLNFYIDNVFVATIKPGAYINFKLPGGQHSFTVKNAKSKKVYEEGYILWIENDGWWFWYGCEDGSHP